MHPLLKWLLCDTAVRRLISHSHLPSPGLFSHQNIFHLKVTVSVCLWVPSKLWDSDVKELSLMQGKLKDFPVWDLSNKKKKIESSHMRECSNWNWYVFLISTSYWGFVEAVLGEWKGYWEHFLIVGSTILWIWWWSCHTHSLTTQT